jgi:hypothetical protein
MPAWAFKAKLFGLMGWIHEIPGMVLMRNEYNVTLLMVDDDDEWGSGLEVAGLVC